MKGWLIWGSVFLILCSLGAIFRPDGPAGNQALFVLFGVAATAWFWGGIFVVDRWLKSDHNKQWLTSGKDACRPKPLTEDERAREEFWAAERRRREENAVREREAEAEQRRMNEQIAKEQAERDRVEREFQVVSSSSLVALTEIPSALLEAEEMLDVAESEFSDGAFAPFWDAIESAVNKIGVADSKLRYIEQSARSYQQLLPKLGRPEPFPVDVEAARGLLVADNTAKRLKAIVRSAQRNFQFATIYEQRKTHQVLLSGFNSFGAAISGLGDQVSESLRMVAERVSQIDGSIRTMHADLADSLRIGRELEVEIASLQAQQAGHQAEEQAQAAKKSLAMLDNIQRGRMPGPFEDTP